MFVNVQWSKKLRTYIICRAHRLHTKDVFKRIIGYIICGAHRPYTKDTCTMWYTCFDVHTVRVAVEMLYWISSPFRTKV